MSPLCALVIGSTGMIGNYLVEQLIGDDAFGTITLLVRKPVQWNSQKVNAVVVDFDNIAQLRDSIPPGDVVFSCVGTTQKNVKGDKALYYKIDRDIPVNVGQIAKEKGYTTFSIVSAIGANAQSGNFYLKLKGDVENALDTIHFNNLHIFRPSMLLGDRNENRPTEKIWQGIFKVLSGLLIGSTRKYRGIEGRDVAKAMIVAAKQNAAGKRLYEYEGMISLIRGKV